MIHARGNDGERLFSSDEFLTSQQISSFFSRLATQKSLLDKYDTEENDDEAAEFENSLEDLTNQVRREVSLQHPIVFDCHNMCDLVKQGKLNKFSIKMLKRLCDHFDLDVSHITVRLKINRSDEGLTLKTSAFLLFTVANLRFQPSCQH